MAAAQILDSNVHELIKENSRVGLSPTPFCRALTKVGDNFHPVLSSEELESETKWCPAFELLGYFFASILMGPSGPHPPILLDNGLETHWWQHLQRWWSQNMRLTKTSFPVSGYQPIRLKGEKRGDTPNRCSLLHPTETCFIFFPTANEKEIHAVWALGEKRWCRRDKIRNLVRLKIVSEKEWKF